MQLIQETDASEHSFVTRWPRRGFAVVRPGSVVAVDPGRVAVLLAETVVEGLPAIIEPGRREWVGDAAVSAAVVFLTHQPARFLWGTAEPMTVAGGSWRAFGTLVIRVTDPLRVVHDLVEARGLPTTDRVESHLRGLVVETLRGLLAGAEDRPAPTAVDLAQRLGPILAALGLELLDLTLGGLERRG